MEPTYVLLGFGAGILTGAIGMGTTAILTPLLLLLGVRPFVAVGTNLTYGAVTKFVGAWTYWRRGDVDRHMLWALGLGSVPAALLGVLALAELQRRGFDPDLYVRRGVGVVLLLIAALFILRSAGVQEFRGKVQRDTLRRGAPVWGAITGLSVSLTSIGAGSLITPFLMAISPSAPDKHARAVGTGLAHATILTAVAATAYTQVGGPDWRLLGSLLAGSIPGSLLGSRIMPRTPGTVLRIVFAIALFASGMKLI